MNTRVSPSAASVIGWGPACVGCVKLPWMHDERRIPARSDWSEFARTPNRMTSMQSLIPNPLHPAVVHIPVALAVLLPLVAVGALGFIHRV